MSGTWRTWLGVPNLESAVTGGKQTLAGRFVDQSLRVPLGLDLVDGC